MAAFDFDELRNKYGFFLFKRLDQKYDKGLLTVSFFYEIPGLQSFETKWIFPASIPSKTDDQILERLLFSLGMVEAISYYKCTCAEVVEVPFAMLDEKQRAWWEKLIWKGLGEFRYVNGIESDPESFVTVRGPLRGSVIPFHDISEYSGVLVPVGGGKDSVVSLELLKGEKITAYTVNCSEAEEKCIEACSHCTSHLRAGRILDKKILEMNQKGYLNGHIPFSAVLAFSAVVTAYLNGIRYIALSNENSANESTVRDSDVNHQYSKSYEFEQDFNTYIEGLTDSDIHYFSLLRPLSELQIASCFARFKQYHKVFRSCNKGSKQGIWCCDCPKCLFVYIILSPFLSDEELTIIFGENLLNKESLDEYFTELCGIAENKPFECVGTRAEVMACLGDFVKKGRTSLLTERHKEFIEKNAPDIGPMLRKWNDENDVPKELLSKIKEAVLS